MTVLTSPARRLAAEWSRCCEDPAASRWAVDLGHDGPVEGLPGALWRDDELALACLAAARSSTPCGVFAGLAVLQALLPALTRLARRDWRASLDDYLAEGWILVMTYPLTRNRRVCTNMALETLHVLSRRRQRIAREVCVDEVHAVAPEPVVEEGTLAGELLEAAAAAEILPVAGLGVLRSVYVEGLSGAQAAARHGLTPEVVRARCSRATRRLRQHREELLPIVA